VEAEAGVEVEAQVVFMEVMEADQSGTNGSHQLLVLRSLDKISEAATTEGEGQRYRHSQDQLVQGGT
jgi:hypothetical protein